LAGLVNAGGSGCENFSRMAAVKVHSQILSLLLSLITSTSREENGDDEAFYTFD
jgi:hypothetical protein